MRLLEGVRVLDLTNVLAGPFATLHLSLLGRRGHQDRESGWRRPGAQARQCAGVQPATAGHELPGTERQQEVTDPQPEGRGGQGDLQEAGAARRRAGGEFPPGRDGAAGFFLRGTPQDQPQDHLLRHHRLRPDRARRLQAGLRSDHPGPFGPDVDQRRRALEPAALRLPGLRHGRRAERGLCHHGGAVPPRSAPARVSSSTSPCWTRSCR